MTKYTVVGMYDAGDSWVEHVEAESVQEAIVTACDEEAYERYNGDLIAVFEGHHMDVYTPDGWSWNDWKCPSCGREYFRADLPNECECGQRPEKEV